MPRKEDREVIRTVYNEEVSKFFESLGLSNKLEQQEIRCAVCSQAITVDNFRAVTNRSGNLIFCCNKEACIEGFNSCLIGDKP